MTLTAFIPVELDYLATQHIGRLSTDYRADLRAITIPALVVHGRVEVNAPFELTGAQTAELVPRAVPKVYETTAHGLYATHADQLDADLIKFIEDRRA